MSDLSKLCGRLGDRAAAAVLNVRLAEIEHYHVEFGCHCGRTVIPRGKLLIGRHGQDRRLAELISRARCERCGVPFERVYLNETHNRTYCFGPEPGWSVQLVPFPGIEAATAEAAG